MSGIAAILNTGGAPVDGPLLDDLTRSLEFRGPDRTRTWTADAVGFGHTLFATTDEAWTEQQPCSLDDDAWIVADARVDGRADLMRTLESAGRAGVRAANDAQLLLHAYGVWGEAMVDHLIGDFAFAIWNRRTRRLFCARDQFGVKPFFYAHCQSTIVISNTLRCVLRHPAVSDRLNDLAVADYLLFYYNKEADTTIYADIRRLPAGHVLTWDAARGLEVRRYWRVTQKPEIRYGRDQDYVDHFLAILREAVGDRLRTRTVGVLMSGGLDSPGVAAVAKQILVAAGTPFDLQAYTVVHDHLIPDDERHFAGVVGSALGIPIEFRAMDDYPLYGREDDAALQTPEPMDEPLLAHITDLYRGIAATRRVVLTGSDLDTVLLERPMVHILALLKRGRLLRLGADLVRTKRVQGRVPRIGIRTLLRERRSRKAVVDPILPVWVNDRFAERLQLRDRVRQKSESNEAASTHPLRPRVSRVLNSHHWSILFEGRDPGLTGVPLEVRHPLADLRLIDYLLSIPLIPWCERKTIVRRAFKGVLPDPIIERPKAPLSADPTLVLLGRTDAAWIDSFEQVPELSEYVDRVRVPRVTGDAASSDGIQHLRPFTLNRWMRYRRRNTNKGADDGERNSVA